MRVSSLPGHLKLTVIDLIPFAVIAGSDCNVALVSLRIVQRMATTFDHQTMRTVSFDLELHVVLLKSSRLSDLILGQHNLVADCQLDAASQSLLGGRLKLDHVDASEWLLILRVQLLL